MTSNLNKSECPPFTASIDGCIVRGFLEDRKEMIKKLKTKGFTRSAIIERAKQLGLSEQFIKRCSQGKSDVALRTCLRCSERFLSEGKQNRLCTRCKNKKW
jgi:uncharacterized paraquat-inducible protein A